MLIRKPTLVLAAFVAAATLTCGCNDSATKDTKTTGDTSGGSTAEATRCQESLRNALTRVDPTKLGISTKTNTAAMGLNDWLKRCGKDGWTDGWKDAVEGLLTEELANRADRRRFGESDSLHIRTSFLMRAYAQVIKQTNEADRIVDLFYAVIRDVALEQRDFPLTPFEVLMTGRGTPEDRAWLFVSALRQLRIDSFVLQPESSGIGHIVGVVSGDDILLFDTKLGLPIFEQDAEPKTLLPRKPVTLSSVTDKILSGMGVEGHEYPVKADALKSAKIQLVGGAGVWAQRNLVLQDALTGEQIATLCDPLQDIGEAPGLLTRVKKATGCADDQVSVWQYPIDQLGEFTRMAEADQKKFNRLIDPLKARVARQKNDAGDEMIFTKPEWELFLGRVDHLQGAGDDVVSIRYQTIRLGRLELEVPSADGSGTVRNPEQFVTLHNRAAEDASLWVPVYQLRDGETQAAVDALIFHRQFYKEDGTWTMGRINYLLALAREANGEPGDAYRAMAAAVEAGGEQKHGNALLLNRAKAIAGDLAVAPAKEEEEKPEDKPDVADGDGSDKSDSTAADSGDKEEEQKKNEEADGGNKKEDQPAK